MKQNCLLFHWFRDIAARGSEQQLDGVHWSSLFLSFLLSIPTIFTQNRIVTASAFFSAMILNGELCSPPTEPAHSHHSESSSPKSSSLDANKIELPPWMGCSLANPGKTMLNSWNTALLFSTLLGEEKPLPLPVPCSPSYMLSTFQEGYEALVLIYEVRKQMGQLNLRRQLVIL